MMRLKSSNIFLSSRWMLSVGAAETTFPSMPRKGRMSSEKNCIINLRTLSSCCEARETYSSFSLLCRSSPFYSVLSAETIKKKFSTITIAKRANTDNGFPQNKTKKRCVKNFLEYRIEISDKISDKNRNKYWKTFFYSLSNVCEYQFKT